MYGLVHSLYVIFYGKLYGKYLIWTGISLLLLLEYISGVVSVSLSKTLVCNCSKRSINTCGILILLQISSSVWNMGFCSYLVTMHARLFSCRITCRAFPLSCAWDRENCNVFWFFVAVLLWTHREIPKWPSRNWPAHSSPLSTPRGRTESCAC